MLGWDVFYLFFSGLVQAAWFSNQWQGGKKDIMDPNQVQISQYKSRRVTVKCLVKGTQQKQSWPVTVDLDDINNAVFGFSMISLIVFPQNTLCHMEEQTLDTIKSLALHDLTEKICDKVENYGRAQNVCSQSLSLDLLHQEIAVEG